MMSRFFRKIGVTFKKRDLCRARARNDRIDAPCLFDGPINGERFRAYVEQFLVHPQAGDAVILKYSPDRNPIEQVFAKFETLLRKAEARSYEAISDASGKILAQYPAAE
jgi:transposase